MSQVGHAARAILDELEKRPDVAPRTLARQLCARWPSMWTNVEHCRRHIRYFLGQSGAKDLNKVTLRDYIRESRKAGFRAEIPGSDAIERVPMEIGPGRTAIISDVHIPYHDLRAVEVGIEYLAKQQPDTLLLNGDIVDFYKLSHFQRDPRLRDPEEELMALSEFLVFIRRKFLKSRIIYKMGNHEQRLDRYMIDKSPELLNVLEWDMNEIMDLKGLGIESAAWHQLMYAGELTILHGHEYPTPVIGPVNAARGLKLRANNSALVGHHHQSSEHIWKDVRGEIFGTWSVGCLCDMSPDYAVLNQWCHGFAVVEVDASGAFEVINKKIIDGKIR